MIYSIVYNTGKEETFLSDRTWEELTAGLERAAAEEMAAKTGESILFNANTFVLTQDFVKTYLDKRGIDHFRLLIE